MSGTTFGGLTDTYAAIEREKQIKGWTWVKKISLIESQNPNWDDLSLDWFEEGDRP